MIILQTPNLTLRELTTADAPFILELLNTPGWLQFIGDRNVHDLKQARNYIITGPITSYHKNGFGLYAIEQNHVAIGVCGLINRDSLPDIDLGFALLTQYASKGFGFEAAAAVLQHALQKLGLQRLVAITQTNNAASIALLENLRFTYEQSIRETDKQTELKLFGLDLTDWQLPQGITVTWP